MRKIVENPNMELEQNKPFTLPMNERITTYKEVNGGFLEDVSELRKEYDAVFVAIGADRFMQMDVPGLELENVMQASTYLEMKEKPKAEPVLKCQLAQTILNWQQRKA